MLTLDWAVKVVVIDDWTYTLFPLSSIEPSFPLEQTVKNRWMNSINGKPGNNIFFWLKRNLDFLSYLLISHKYSIQFWIFFFLLVQWRVFSIASKQCLESVKIHPRHFLEASVKFSALKSRFPYFGRAYNGARAKNEFFLFCFFAFVRPSPNFRAVPTKSEKGTNGNAWQTAWPCLPCGRLLFFGFSVNYWAVLR